MPQADLKYSADLDIDAVGLLAAIEETIQGHDAGSGKCKGRAYPASAFHHTHVILEVGLLAKPHRDQAYTDDLMARLERTVTGFLPGPCELALKISYNPLSQYKTQAYSPA